MKKFLALFLVLALVGCLFTACASKNESAATNDAAASDAKAADSDGYVIALCNHSLGETWRVQMVAEFEQAADALVEQGVIKEYYETNADADASKQISDMQDLIAKGVDGIVISACNPTALNDVIEEATAAGIKVVNFNMLATTDQVVAKVNQSDQDFGRIGAEFLAEALGGKGKIIALQGVAGTPVCIGRWEGAKAVFDQYPDIEILAEAYADWDYSTGKAATESLLSAYPEIDGVWSSGGASTQGAIDAFIAAGRPLVPMSGEGGNGFLASWKKYQGVDKFDSVAPVYDCAMVVDALDILIDALDGKEVVFDQSSLPMDKITADTIDEYYRSDLPDSYWAGTRLTEENLAKLFAINN